MNYFEPITKFLSKAVDKYFVRDSQSVILEHGNKFIDVNFDEAGYVKIADFLLDGLSNYYRTQEQPNTTSDLAGYGSGYTYADHAAYANNNGTGVRDGFAIGGTTVRWEIYKLQWCRGRQFRIDHISNEETGKIVTGGLIEDFHKYKVIPEVDACRFGFIADSASVSLGNLVTETVGTDITASNILSKFFDARKWLVEHEVPLEDIVWFMSPEVYTLIMNSSDLVKFITQEDYKNDNGLTFEVKKFNGVPIIEVVPSRFFTSVAVTENGFTGTSGSKAINYIICSKKCILPIRKIEYQKLYGEEQAGIAGFYGTMMNYLLYHGIVIPKNKLVGTYVSVGSAGTGLAKVNTLSVDIRAGSNTNGWRLKAYFTTPSALRGTVVYGDSAFTVGSTVNIAESNVAELDAENTDAVKTAYYFALVDYRGVVIAASGSVTLVKKA